MDPKILIVFHTVEGQTAHITDRIASVLRAAGDTVDFAAAEEAPVPDGYDAVVAGDSIHAVHHSGQLVRYLEEHAPVLNAMPAALFQVSLASANPDEEHTATAQGFVHELLGKTHFEPDIVALFAGALVYTQYGWFKRRVMRAIVKREGGDTDMSHDYEYTDWNAVDQFARDVDALRGRRATLGRDPIDAIETEGLTKSYGSARGIVDLDLTVPAGTIFGFLGPNGAGKTTTIRVLLDFLRPTRGRALVLGLDSRLDSVAIKRRIGYVPGDPALYERLTGSQLLDWLARLRGGIDPTWLQGLTQRFALDLDRPIRTLSRGNRQKIALVQAFMHRPELLILDEPTSGLDPLLQHEFAELVREVRADGATVFLSSHLLDEVQHVCDRVAIVREGCLVTVEEVETLRERAVREVTIRFDHPIDPAPFEALAGVSDVEVRDATLHCHLVGVADALVKLAAHHTVIDFTSAPPDLDAMFLQFYETGKDLDGDARR